MQFSHTGISNRESLRFVLRAREKHSVTNVGLHLPDVGRVSFKDVDRVEADLILVLICELVQGGNLPPKWRSGIAPEDEDYRLGIPKRGELERRLVFECLYCEIWSRIARVQLPVAGLGPHRLEGKQEICRRGHMHHHSPELLRRLMHCPEHESDEAQPRNDQAARDPR
jgi:hypothetical protein